MKIQDIKRFFEGDLDVENLIKQISLRVPNANLIPKKDT